MKNKHYFPTNLILLVLALLTACVSGKKYRASNLRIQQLKIDSINTHQKLKTQVTFFESQRYEMPAAQGESPVEEKKVYTTQNSVLIVDDIDVFEPFPPVLVTSVFRSNYPLAIDVSWVREMPKVKDGSIKYRANFLIEGKKREVVLMANGKFIKQ
jgi:hypothetical protein